MAIIVRTSIETAIQYASGSVETDSFKKKQQVFFKVIVDNFDLKRAVDFARTDSNIIMIKYEGDPVSTSFEGIDFHGVYVVKEFEVNNSFDMSEMEHIMSCLPDGMNALIKLPEDFCDMEMLYKINSVYRNVRFCGGYLFNTGEIKMGCIGRDIAENNGIRYKKGKYLCQGCSCVFNTYDEYEVNLNLVKKKERRVKSSSAAKPKTTAVKQKKKSYADLITNSVSL